MSRRVIPTAETRGLWRLDEPAGGAAINIDDPGTHDGINNGTTPVAVSAMPFAWARDFDGVSNITVADDANLRPGSVSVGSWVKRSAWPAVSTERWLSKWNDAVPTGWVLGCLGVSTINWDIQTTGGTDVVTFDPSSLSAAVYHLIYGTYDQTTMRLYVDGLEVANKAHAFPGAVVYGPEAVTIGSRVDGTDKMTGQLAECHYAGRGAGALGDLRPLPGRARSGSRV